MNDYDVITLDEQGVAFCLKSHIYADSAASAVKQATARDTIIDLGYRYYIGCKSNYKAEIQSKLSHTEIIKFHNLACDINSNSHIYLMEDLESVLGDSFKAIYPRLGERFNLDDTYFIYRKYDRKFYSYHNFPNIKIDYTGIVVELYKAKDKRFTKMFD